MPFQFELGGVGDQIIHHYVSVLTPRIQLSIVIFKEHAGHRCFVERELMNDAETALLCVASVRLSVGYIKVIDDDGSRRVANRQLISRDL